MTHRDTFFLVWVMGAVMIAPLSGCNDESVDSVAEASATGDGGAASCPQGIAPLGATLSGATCPADSTVSYENDIAPLMQTYCTGCHRADLVGAAARNCATEGHNFETADGIIEEAYHVDLAAAAGPDSTNVQMPPPGYPAPTAEERQKLGEWLACNAPDVAVPDDD